MNKKWVGLRGYNWSRLRELILNNKLASLIIFLGISLRIVFWATLLPLWKHFAMFAMFKMPLLQYLGNFEGYKPSRSPFYDLFSAALYLPTNSVLGVRAVTVFTLLISIISVPAMFIAARRLFNREVAVFSTILYALYPKFLVLTGQGLPEVAGTGFVVLSLVALTDSSGSLRGSVSAGIGVTFAYLSFIPAVLFAIYTGLFLFGQWVRSEGLSFSGDGEDFRGVVAYNIIPFIVGVFYLFYGPVQELFKTASAEAGSSVYPLFIDPSKYSVIEKIIRYIGYQFFDFWWHMRGFDKEQNVLSTIQKTASFLGDWSNIFFSGWLLITLIFTLPIIVGFIQLIRHRQTNSIYIVGICIIYVFAHIYRNLGWVGAFQFRHILIVFPALCLCFGVGMRSLCRYITVKREQYFSSTKIDSSLLPISPSMLQLIAIIGFAVLISVAFVNIQYTTENYKTSTIEPIDRLTAEVGPEEQVAVTDKFVYRRTVLYSEGEVIPSLWWGNDLRGDPVDRTVIADIRPVTPANISNASEDYLFISNKCGLFSERQNRFIDAAIETNGTFVFNKTIDRRARCDISNALIKL